MARKRWAGVVKGTSTTIVVPPGDSPGGRKLSAMFKAC